MVSLGRPGIKSRKWTGGICAQSKHLILQGIPTVKLRLGTHVVVDAFHVLVFVPWRTAAYVLRSRVGDLLKHRSVRIRGSKCQESVGCGVRSWLKRCRTTESCDYLRS